ncbi:hypothetical protein BS50DRAFT_627702 [Corynespora cassiicola Philippines]|uniref:Ubiquitin-like protease family profile domain-containing protein n=1 Tax=Corynespora cassiicola Philippines TaxID=1448308 RepID=A0A2T2PAH6_CORCC|nr:hypothetical protein BS50DRAFT_627702 [Corynespora cassiicola Philippines]
MESFHEALRLLMPAGTSPHKDVFTPGAAGHAATASSNGHARPSSAQSQPAIDLTTSPKDRKRPAASPSSPSSNKKARRSSDEKRLCADFRTPADAVHAPDPALFTFGSPANKMKPKPGGANSYKPVNTIDEANRHTGQRKNLTTYGGHRASRTIAATGFLEGFDTLDEEMHRATAHKSAFSASTPTKKRKIQHLPSTSHEVISVDDDEDELMGPPTWQTTRQHSKPNARSARSVTSASKQSFVSGGTIASRSQTSLSSSSFRAVDQLVNPHRKRSRNPNGRKLGSALVQPLGSVGPGTTKDSPVQLEDEDTKGIPAKPSSASLDRPLPSSRTSSPDQLQEQDRSSYSKYWPARDTKRLNHSTSPRRRGMDPSQQGEENLRDIFRRSGDEESTPTKPRNSPSVALSPSLVKKSKKKSSILADGLPLRFARTHGYEHRGDDIWLKSGPSGNALRVTVLDEEKLSLTRASVDLQKIIRATVDDISRIRVTGPRQHDGNMYVLDLEFANTNDFVFFRDSVLRDTTNGRLTYKDSSAMRRMFEKPLLHNDKVGSTPLVDDTTSTKNQQHLSPSNESSRLAVKSTRMVDRMQADSPERQVSDKQRHENARSQISGTSVRPTRTTRTSRPTYNLDFEPEEKPEKFSVVHGLGKPWEKPVQYGSGRRRALVEHSDLERLDDDTMLNDSLIDFYMIYLFNQAKLPADKVYFFNTHFFTALTRPVPRQKTQINYPAVSRWTSKDDIFKHDYIVVPINDGNLHWYLAIICNVSNISRKPVVDIDRETAATSEPRKLEPADETPKHDEEKSVLELPDSGTEGGTTSSKKTISTEQDNSKPSEDIESGTNVAGAVARHTNKMNLPDNHTTESSPPAEARMEKLSIDDEIPKGILRESHPSPVKKKVKRKSGLVRRVDPHEPVIIILDSLASSLRSKAVRVLKDYIHEEGKAKRGMEANITQNGFYAKEAQIPTQTNFSDCGVYVLGYAQKFFSDPDGFVHRIISGEMDSEIDWPDMEPGQMRKQIRDILIAMGDEQRNERKRAHAMKKEKNKISSSHPSSSLPSGHPTNTVNNTVDDTKHKNTVREEAPKSDSKSAATMELSSILESDPSSDLNTSAKGKPEQLPTATESPRQTIRKASTQVVIMARSPKRPLDQDTRSVETQLHDSHKRQKASVERHPSTVNSPTDKMTLPTSGQNSSIPSPPSGLVQSSRSREGNSNDPICIDDSQETAERSSNKEKPYSTSTVGSSSPSFPRKHKPSGSTGRHIPQGTDATEASASNKGQFPGTDLFEQLLESSSVKEKPSLSWSIQEGGDGGLAGVALSGPEASTTVEDDSVVPESPEHLCSSPTSDRDSWQHGSALPL